MTAPKTNERPGTRAALRNSSIAPNKVREVLNLIRDVEYDRASDILAHTDRAAAPVIAKLLHSAAANAEHNDGLDPRELFVATCYADEGTTLKRWRPRARGRATRIRKRSCHITIILARMPDEKIARRRARVAAEAADRRARRVAGTRRRDAATSSAPVTDETATELVSDLIESSAVLPEPTETDVVENDVIDVDAVGTDEVAVEAADEDAVEADADETEEVEPVGVDATATEDEADDATEEDGN